jgi:hypothetical protein
MSARTSTRPGSATCPALRSEYSNISRKSRLSRSSETRTALTRLSLLTELTRATAEMTAAQSLAPLNKVAYRLSISTLDGVPVVIDQLDPPVRAVLRAVLAQLHHDPTDA